MEKVLKADENILFVPFSGNNEINSAYRTFLDRTTSCFFLKNLQLKDKKNPAPSKKKFAINQNATILRTFLVCLKKKPLEKQTKTVHCIYLFPCISLGGIRVGKYGESLMGPCKNKLSFLSLSQRSVKVFTESVCPVMDES